MTTVVVTTGAERRAVVKAAVLGVLPEVREKLASAPNVLVKANLVHHLNQLASTHVDAVRAVLDVIRAVTQAPITVADASYHGTKAAFRNFGYENLLSEYHGVELVDLNEDQTVMGSYVKRDGTLGTMGVSKRATEAGFTINLTPMKTHRDVGAALAIKSWTIGTWVAEPRYGAQGKYWPRWPFLHEQGAWAHHRTIAERLGVHKPDLSIIDAFLAMEGDGPTRGSAVLSRLALAGVDPVALDTVGCRLMGIDPGEIGYLVFASERGYGVGDETQIDIRSPEPISRLSRPFAKPESWESQVLAWRDRENLKLI